MPHIQQIGFSESHNHHLVLPILVYVCISNFCKWVLLY
jgi:hypothetical protein